MQIPEFQQLKKRADELNRLYNTPINKGRHKKEGRLVSYKLSDNCLTKINYLAATLNKSKTSIIENAINYYFDSHSNTSFNK